MIKYKNVMAAHEVRMWLSTVIIPLGLGIGALVQSNKQQKVNVKKVISLTAKRLGGK